MHFKFLIYLCIGKVPCTSDMYTVWEKKRATRLPCSGFNGILSFKVDIRVRFMILKKSCCSLILISMINVYFKTYILINTDEFLIDIKKSFISKGILSLSMHVMTLMKNERNTNVLFCQLYDINCT